MIKLEYYTNVVVNISLEPFQEIPHERIKELIKSVSLQDAFMYPGPKIFTRRTGLNHNLCFECTQHQVVPAVNKISYLLNLELGKISDKNTMRIQTIELS